MSRLLYLQPGQFVASGEPLTISTVLGSCVAVCLFDGVARVGGVNHFLLPEAPDGSASPRYAAPALSALVAEVRALGSHNGHLKAQLFGGACVLEAFQHPGHLGSRNVDVARQWLRAARIPIVGEHVGGGRGRRLQFSLPEGRTAVKVL